MDTEKLKIIVDDKGKTTIWMDGKKVKGARKINFEFIAGEAPTHEIEFYTQFGGLKDER